MACQLLSVLREPSLLEFVAPDTTASPVTCVECPITLRPGCSLGSDARITTDCALRGTDAVASLLGIQPVLQRRKADALRTSNIYVQEAVSSTCRHFPAKGLRVLYLEHSWLIGSAESSQRPRVKIETPPTNCGKV